MSGMKNLMVGLCGRTGQTGAMDALDYLISSPTALDKVPYIALVGLRDGIEPARATANDLTGAVLLYEYRVAGFRSRVFATDDVNGQRTVIAPSGKRMQVAEAAGRCLVAGGALMTLISLEAELESEAMSGLERPQGRKTPPCNSAVRTRTVARDLPLASTVEATLAILGRNTRRNFRRYRLRLEADLCAAFVPSVEISREEFLELNRNSTNRFSDAEAAWRHACFSGLPDMLFGGVRAGDGRWLSLIGGRRHDGITDIEWQVNRAGLPSYSLSTVMRSYLLEHEVALGTRSLSFKGGTPHSMSSAFLPSDSVDLLMMRRTPEAFLLRAFSRWLFPKSNFLGLMLQDRTLVWNKG